MLRSRKELTIIGIDPEKQVDSRNIWHCMLCWEHGSDVTDIIHRPDCILASASVTHVKISAMQSRIVLHRTTAGTYWWTSSISGLTYYIKRRGSGRWGVTHRSSSSEAIVDYARLSSVRSWIREHQREL